jgi:hypothetical protein
MIRKEGPSPSFNPDCLADILLSGLKIPEGSEISGGPAVQQGQEPAAFPVLDPMDRPGERV